MSLKKIFEKNLREKLVNNIPSSDIRSILFERVALPILTKISGVSEYEEWSKQFNDKNASKQDDLNDVMKKLGLKVRLHWNESEEDTDKQNMFIFNHPTGPLEAIFAQYVVQHMGLKGKIIGDEILSEIELIKDCYIPLSIRSGENSSGRKLAQLRNLKREVRLGHSLIIFPSGAVSKKDIFNQQILEYDWQTGFLELSKSNLLNLIPCYIDARLSLRYYIVKYINKDMSSLILFRECLDFLKRNNGNIIDVYIGKQIHHNSFDVTNENASKFQSICEALKFKLYNNKIVKP